MSKSLSNIEPVTFEKYSDESTLCNYDVVKKEKIDEVTEKVIYEYEYEQVIVQNPVTYNKLVESMIRDKYSISDELSLLRQRSSKKTEFSEYNTYAEHCKEVAKNILNI